MWSEDEVGEGRGLENMSNADMDDEEAAEASKCREDGCDENVGDRGSSSPKAEKGKEGNPLSIKRSDRRTSCESI